MAKSPTLGLTMMSASQAQKEVVFNEFLIAMDALFRGVVISATLTAPPASPNPGDTYIIASGATGAWSGQDHNIAFYFNGWQFVTAKDHMRLYDQTATVWRVYHANTASWDAEPASTVSVLNDLTNVQGSPTDGQVLTYVLADGKWEPKNPMFTAALSTLTDVSVTEGDAINGQALAWDKVSGKWKAKAFLTTIPSFMSLPGVESPSGLAANWVAVYDQTSNALTFARPSSLITVSSLNQVGDVSYPVGGVGMIPSGASLVWNGATWAPSNEAPATIGITGIVNGPGGMDGNAGKIIRVNSVESAWEYAAYTLANLADVHVTTGPAIDGYVLAWNNGTGKWVASAHGIDTLASLTDVQVTEGSAIDGQVLAWKNSDSKWEPKALATVAVSGAYNDLTGKPPLAAVALSGSYSDLSGKPAIPTNNSFGLSGLGDVSVSPGAGIDGYVLKWNNATSKWVASATGGGGGALATLTDVNVSEGSAIDGKYLKWDNGSSKWVASIPALGALANVTLSATPSNGQVLAFSSAGANWVNATLTSNLFSLGGLGDTSITTGSGVDGYVVYWDNGAGKFKLKPSGGGGGTLATLTDVNLTEGAGIDGYALVWNNATSKWVAQAVSGGTGGSSTLAGDTDVSITSPGSGDLLTYDVGSSKWKNKSLTGVIGSQVVRPPVIVQSKAFCQDDSPFTLDRAPTPGNMLVAFVSHWSSGTTVGAGWNRVQDARANNDYASVCVKLVPPGDTASQSPVTGCSGADAVFFELFNADIAVPLALATFVDSVAATQNISSGAPSGSLILGAFTTTSGASLPTSITGATAGPTASASSGGGSGYGRSIASFYQSFTAQGGANVAATYASAADCNGYILVVSGAPITGGAALLPAHYELGAFAPPDPSWFDMSGSALTTTMSTVTNRGAKLSAPVSTSDKLCFGRRSVSGWGSNWSVTARLIPSHNLNSNYPGIGLFVQDTGGKIMALMVQGINGYLRATLITCTNNTTYLATVASDAIVDAPTWFKVSYDGTNLTFGISYNGLDYATKQVAANSFLGTLAYVGIGGDSHYESGPTFTPTTWSCLCTHYSDPDFPASGHTTLTSAKIGQLADVSTATPSDGQVLVYSAATGTWVNGTVPGKLTPPVAANLTAQTNLNGATLTQRTSGVEKPCLHVKPGATNVSGVIYCALQAPPSGGDLSAVVKVKSSFYGYVPDQFQGAGLVFRDGSSNMYLSAAFINNASGSRVTRTLGGGAGPSFNTGSADGKFPVPDEDVFLHADWNSTAKTLAYSVSRNGIDKIAVYTEVNLQSIAYVGIGWNGAANGIGTTGVNGPEYDFLHYYVGAAGTNGL